MISGAIDGSTSGRKAGSAGLVSKAAGEPPPSPPAQDGIDTAVPVPETFASSSPEPFPDTAKAITAMTVTAMAMARRRR
jgi:hypothetical protein